MALQLSMQVKRIGADFPVAYAKIARVTADKTTTRLDVEVYASAAARTAGSQPLETINVRMATPTSINGSIFSHLYGLVKALPAFAGSTDV